MSHCFQIYEQSTQIKNNTSKKQQRGTKGHRIPDPHCDLVTLVLGLEREMLRASALTENMSSIPRTHMVPHNCLFHTCGAEHRYTYFFFKNWKKKLGSGLQWVWVWNRSCSPVVWPWISYATSSTKHCHWTAENMTKVNGRSEQVAHACILGWHSSRSTWTLKFTNSLDNTGRPHLRRIDEITISQLQHCRWSANVELSSPFAHCISLHGFWLVTIHLASVWIFFLYTPNASHSLGHIVGSQTVGVWTILSNSFVVDSLWGIIPYWMVS